MKTEVARRNIALFGGGGRGGMLKDGTAKATNLVT